MYFVHMSHFNTVYSLNTYATHLSTLQFVNVQFSYLPERYGNLNIQEFIPTCSHCAVLVFRAVSILPNRIIGTVGEHAGFPVEALSLSHCRQWIASCSHDQLVKFSDVREVLSKKVDGHKRLKRTEQRKMLSSKVAAEQDFFGDLDLAKQESAERGGDQSCSEDDSSDSESGEATQFSRNSKMSYKNRDADAGVGDRNNTDKDDEDDDIETGDSSEDCNDNRDDDNDDE